MQTAVTIRKCRTAVRGPNGHLQLTDVSIPQGTTVTVVGFWSGTEWPEEIPGQYVQCEFPTDTVNGTTYSIRLWISAANLERTNA